MRVAIDGTQSTGKTTLFTALRQENLTGFAFLDEAARKLGPRLGIKITQDWVALFGSPSRHLDFLRELYQYQSSLENSACRFITDGSLYKILAYASVFGFALDDVSPNIRDILYDLIVYCPPNVAFQGDGFRYEEKRTELAEELQSLHARFYRGALIVANGSTSERLDQVQSALRR
jgi:nicotinamide riboside kinase